MPISATSGYRDAASLEVQREIAVMKKTADAQEAQAQALVAMIRQSVPQPREGVGRLIDVSA